MTVSNTSNGGMVLKLLYQIQAILGITVSNTSDFLNFVAVSDTSNKTLVISVGDET